MTEKISQPPSPFHPTPRGWAGPNLLAMILSETFGQHQPLNGQAERYAKEGAEISLSTLADQVGACTVALQPIHDLIRAHARIERIVERFDQLAKKWALRPGKPKAPKATP